MNLQVGLSKVQDLGFGLGASGLGSRVYGLELGVLGIGPGVQGFGAVFS